jgi:hypothetical protein
MATDGAGRQRPGPVRRVDRARPAGALLVGDHPMRRIVCLVSPPAVVAALLLVAPGCGGEQKETGTTVEVSDQMIKEAQASDAYYMEQQKQGKAKRAGGS